VAYIRETTIEAMTKRSYSVIVIGGGHAGVEAAVAAANMLRARNVGDPSRPPVALVTLNPAKTGVMSCNPAIGGIAKGQMVREVDALGGLMGRAADATGIMFKMLNTSKGAAVRSPRAQCDRHAYARWVRSAVEAHEHIDVIGAAAERFIIERDARSRRVCRGLVLAARDEQQAAAGVDGLELHAGAIVLTTGTFMRGLMHTGESRTEGGRAGEAPAVGISATLRELGFELGRLKTGTPPRLRSGTIEWDRLDKQWGDEPPIAFSELSSDERVQRRGDEAPSDVGAGRHSFQPELAQVACGVTSTTPAVHDLIRANIHRAPMFSGQIESRGPRYCPSIEDKVVRFADRESHHVFLEPESHDSDWVYCNGVASSLPADVQAQIVAGMRGCERAEVVQWGYAVEYDMVRPHQIFASGETKLIDRLFLAGQINGTSGYEEAAGQGLIAGVNAVRRVFGEPCVELGRDEAYIGVMMDDLVTKTPVEPYRMFTSRAEYRLLLRADNAADRLTPLGRELGLVDDERWAAFERRREELDAVRAAIDAGRVGEKPLTKLMRRQGFDAADLVSLLGDAARDIDARVIVTALAERQYAGYIDRQRAEIRRHASMERRRIPAGFAFDGVRGLRAEAREALERFRPETFGQAGRLEGVTPADITLLMVSMKRGGGAGSVRTTTARANTQGTREPRSSAVAAS
jgi:tRNA uridine 5-carboxymethylaminomethyl modification enzyme